MELNFELGSFGLGAIIAAILSYRRNGDVLLAIVHFMFNWLYVLYYLVTSFTAPKE